MDPLCISVCSVQPPETVDCSPRGFSVPHEMSLRVVLLRKQSGRIVVTSGV